MVFYYRIDNPYSNLLFNEKAFEGLKHLREMKLDKKKCFSICKI